MTSHFLYNLLSVQFVVITIYCQDYLLSRQTIVITNYRQNKTIVKTNYRQNKLLIVRHLDLSNYRTVDRPTNMQ